MLSVLDPVLCKKISQLDPVRELSSGHLFAFSRLDGETEAIKEILSNDRTYEQFLRYVAKRVDDPQDPLTLDGAYDMLTDIRRVSYCATYADISSDMYQNLSSKFNFGSMAYENAEDYSTVGHTHGYSNVYVRPVVSEGIHVADIILREQAGSKRYPVYVPQQKIEIEQINKIGDVKFIARNNLQRPSVLDDDFDGWVYADGSRYSRDMFPQAYEVYKELEGSNLTSFVVPRIENFILPDHQTGPDGFGVVPFTNSLTRHTHSIDNSQLDAGKFQNITLKLDLPYYNAGGSSLGKNGVQHTGYNSPSKKFSISVELDLATTVVAATKTTPSSGDETESYPQYIDLPTMVYIGGVK